MALRKRFGQHFLQPAWADRLVEVIAPRQTDEFLEIGPGPGALTLRLAPRVEHVTAVEIDRDLAAALAPKLPANVDLVVADFLAFDLAAVLRRAPLRVAGNLPYNVSSPILFRLIDAYKSHHEPAFTDATVLLQLEVAERLAAAAGSREYGVLSISVQLYADVERLLTLPPGAFRPAPKVHSAVVRLSFRPPRVGIRDGELFDRMVRSMFTRRRKTLVNALAPFAETLATDARQALAAAEVDPVRRPETLQLPELARLVDAFAALPRLAAGENGRRKGRQGEGVKGSKGRAQVHRMALRKTPRADSGALARLSSPLLPFSLPASQERCVTHPGASRLSISATSAAVT